jgi:hypothetical protein
MHISYLILNSTLTFTYFKPLESSGHSSWVQVQRSRVRFPALPDFVSSSGSGTGSTQPREQFEELLGRSSADHATPSIR